MKLDPLVIQSLAWTKALALANGLRLPTPEQVQKAADDFQQAYDDVMQGKGGAGGGGGGSGSGSGAGRTFTVDPLARAMLAARGVFDRLHPAPDDFVERGIEALPPALAALVADAAGGGLTAGSDAGAGAGDDAAEVAAIVQAELDAQAQAEVAAMAEARDAREARQRAGKHTSEELERAYRARMLAAKAVDAATVALDAVADHRASLEGTREYVPTSQQTAGTTAAANRFVGYRGR